jgi:hypothetical protein
MSNIKKLQDEENMNFGSFILGEIWNRRLYPTPGAWMYDNKKVSIVDILKIYQEQNKRENLETRLYTKKEVDDALSFGYHTAKDEANGGQSSGYGTRFFESISDKHKDIHE